MSTMSIYQRAVCIVKSLNIEMDTRQCIVCLTNCGNIKCIAKCGTSICYSCYCDTDAYESVYDWYDLKNKTINKDTIIFSYYCSINCFMLHLTTGFCIAHNRYNKLVYDRISIEQSLIQDNIKKRFTKHVLPQLINILIKDVANITIKYCI